MQKESCDLSPMKDQLIKHMSIISTEIQSSMDSLVKDDVNDERKCFLSRLNEIRESFNQVESIAASFYLQCYLSSFTSHYLDLSISIQHLSARRHGALIVFQRNDRLDMFIHSGIMLEAALTYSLLESIFYPGSPLHDGAILIQSDRIVSAANVLPVSDSTLDNKLGTRHRAAIGLTERCDAVVLVVSEETGNASFAFKGSLHPLNSISPVS
jgi:diadenylate cyclase